MNKGKNNFFLDKTSLAILSGISLAVALAWNSAIQDSFKLFFQQGSGLIGQFLYAIVVTILLVIISYSLGKK